LGCLWVILAYRPGFALAIITVSNPDASPKRLILAHFAGWHIGC
jgi:hypothetical protein